MIRVVLATCIAFLPFSISAANNSKSERYHYEQDELECYHYECYEEEEEICSAPVQGTCCGLNACCFAVAALAIVGGAVIILMHGKSSNVHSANT
ncbi:MAG: hypothetical protein S4CHLAM81_05260 [Chlamydiales bacterium]|nr:hypothetical protein [Chlamydiales bacterium]MCH9635312.1 hypothetical protein [Chlamydiales bacterium]MCH9704213.1 hypothetical protein [Chlamydiota bacterium]